MPSVALTDHGNLFGAIDFYKAAKEQQLKPILGCELAIAPASRFEKKKGPPPSHLILLAENNTGYSNLSKLSSLAFTEGFYFVPRIDLELLEQYNEGLICLTGCIKGLLAQSILNKRPEETEQTLSFLQKLFPGRLYLELQRLHSSHEDIQADNLQEETWLYQQYRDFVAKQTLVETELLQLKEKFALPLVATNNCHYLERKDWKAHEVLLNVQSGEPCLLKHQDPYTGTIHTTPNPKREVFSSHEYYFKTQEEMRALFSDLPEAIENSAHIAERCHVEIDFATKHYPVFIPPSLTDSPEANNHDIRIRANGEYLEELCRTALPKKYDPETLKHVQAKHPDKDPLQLVEERLTYELGIIISKGMADYLLIVRDFTNWAKKNGIPMGPGRGSGVGSIVLYLIGITEIEPLRFNLFFERFINPERFSYPDIDVDMCMDRRGEVINYTIQKYGKNNVAQIITFGTMKAKMSVRDVGRVLNIPLPKVNQIVKLIPDDLNITLETALEAEADLRNLYAQDEETKQIIDVAQILEGSIRNTGIHAAGLVISGEPLLLNVPVCIAKDSDMCVTQYSMKPVEMVGMLKVDFLGLKTLTSLKLCTQAARKRFKIDLAWENLPLDDEKTFLLLNQGKTLGTFQLESGGMTELAKQLHLDRFEEIIAVGALYRPGPMDMIPSFIARKHKREPIEYDHPALEPILQETYGIMVYQEQVMQIAQKLSNYSLAEGDVLRKAMGKKDAKEMTRQRVKFIEGASKNNIPESLSAEIFDKMEKFAQYGFNKSHATAYAYLTYATAYMKANFPGEWMAALMTSSKDDIEKVAKFMHEALALGIKCLAPDINESENEFAATDSGIRFALSAIKGIGEQVVEAILEERTKHGLFSSLENFLQRIDHKKVGKKTIELLIDAGCFDQFGSSRDLLLHQLDSLFDEAAKRSHEKECGVLHLFDSLPIIQQSKPPSLIKRGKEELLFREKQLLGLFISGHPLKLYAEVQKRLGTLTLKDIEHLADPSVFRLAFMIDTAAIKTSSKSGKKFAILRILDKNDESMELPIWSELYETYMPLIRENQLLWGVFTKESSQETTTIQCRWLGDLKNCSKEALEEDDTAYSKAQQQLERAKKRPFSKTQNKATTTGTEAPKKTESKRIFLTCNLQKARASHILALKMKIEEHKGEDELILNFVDPDGEVASLQLPPSFKVKWTKKLQEELSKVANSIVRNETL